MDSSQFRSRFAGPSCGFLKELTQALKGKSAPVHLQKEIEGLRKEDKAKGERRKDDSLDERHQAICKAVGFLCTGDGDLLQEAIDAMDKAYAKLLPHAHAPYPGLASAGRLIAAMNKFLAQRSLRDLASAPFAHKNWSPGTFLLHDWLLALVSTDPQPAQRDATRILTVFDHGGNSLGTVQKLVVEKRDGADGLIIPDFFSFCLAAFPKEPNGDNFVGVMHQAFSDVIPKEKPGRLRWYLESVQGAYPDAFSGRSAQVAAACCAMALYDKNRHGDEALLDDRVAVTACLGPRAAEPEEWRLLPFPEAEDPDREKRKRVAEVEEIKLPAKFDAAARARLVAVLVCPSQVPESGKFGPVTLPDKTEHEILIQPVSNLEEAYDSTLLMSSAMREYAQSIWDEWPWTEEPTPQEYIDAAKRDGN